MENAGEPPLALVGHYRLLSLIGEGGSGRVYRAWDPRLQREVALKVLRDRSGAEPARLQRFIEEARAASALNHPNMVTVYDAAVSGTPFIVTELVEGRRLRDELGRGPLPLRRTLDVAEPAGSIQVEALSDPAGARAQFWRKRRQELELRPGEDGPQTKLGGLAGDPGEEE